MPHSPAPATHTGITDHVTDLTRVIMQALPSVNQAVAAHRTDGCMYCKASADQRDCPTLGLASRLPSDLASCGAEQDRGDGAGGGFRVVAKTCGQGVVEPERGEAVDE
jgi:hypothetical protein